MQINKYDTIVIGAGAAGLMAAATCAKRGRSVLLLESTSKIGEKIRISGGGRCNFTNINASPRNYLSNNPHFIKSALARYSQHDFIELVESYKIAYHEKTLGQLFCDHSSVQIIDMLVSECNKYQVNILVNTQVLSVTKSDQFNIESSRGSFHSTSLIIATGGLSIPKIGASGFGYELAKQFGLNIIETKPALAPLTVFAKDLDFFKNLSGISIDSIVSYPSLKSPSFRENILFTHRGLSGPAILQISSYLKKQSDEILEINLLPNLDLLQLLIQNKNSKVLITNFMKGYMPNRFVDSYFEDKRIVDYTAKELELIANSIHKFKVIINDTEGYTKAEVTVGGIDTKELSSKTMEALKVPNLYFIGEVVDVTGWLGGYNFQWAWSSGFVSGSYA
ncbi:MAG: NAD(P)/FAD-dependent oxidoreductase [Rickettsiales bacterium]